MATGAGMLGKEFGAAATVWAEAVDWRFALVTSVGSGGKIDGWEIGVDGRGPGRGIVVVASMRLGRGGGVGWVRRVRQDTSSGEVR